eukprot:GFUD01029857.1.p1 GENE.GFUD01029857.1~~GFUD01029857.1.p1  ORF type:complete len:299 (+),score=59.71 GFUD01029857.1:202-1098(+)
MESITKGKLPQLSLLRDPSFGIPSDITFQIIGNTGEVAEGNVVLGEVKGHKIILGLFSSAFKNQFFGSQKETRDVIPVKDTTVAAFEKLFDYIYRKDINWGGMTVLEIYEVVHLADKYTMPDLMNEIKTQMENVPLTVDSLVEVAHLAAQFTQFTDVSSALLVICAKFLQKTFKTPNDQLQFAINLSGTGKEVTVLQLLVLARDLPALECSNCREEQCMDGLPVGSIDKFTAGCKLKINANCANYGGAVWSSNYVYTVSSVVDNTAVNLRTGAGRVGLGIPVPIIAPNRFPTFCFNCS